MFLSDSFQDRLFANPRSNSEPRVRSYWNPKLKESILKKLLRVAGTLILGLAMATAIAPVSGCGKKDINADLKPVSPDAPRPKLHGEGKAKAPGEKAPVVIK